MIVHAQYKYKYELISAYAFRNDMVGTHLFTFIILHTSNVYVLLVYNDLSHNGQ